MFANSKTWFAVRCLITPGYLITLGDVRRAMATSLRHDKSASPHSTANIHLKKRGGKPLQHIAKRYAEVPFLPGALNRSCFMNSRKKVGADPIWNHDELPPRKLIESLHLERAAINQDEFSRAEWFWNRRPKLVFENLCPLFCYIVVFVCLLYLVPESIAALLVWMLLGVSCVFVDCVRLGVWRAEYESSIKRVVSHLSERDK